MTTKKSLTDMLKEEMDKPATEEGETKVLRRGAPTKSDLEVELARLASTLAAKEEELTTFAPERAHLQQRVQELEAEKQMQQDHIRQLQTYLDQTQELKMALERSEAEKQQLQAELAQLQPKLVKQKPQIPVRPIASNQILSQLSNQSIGWFD